MVKGRLSLICGGAMAAILGWSPVGAADQTPSEAQQAKLAADTAWETAEKANLEAKAARIAAQAALDKARIDALGLPAFSGVTQIEQGGGAMEATILSSAALGSAARKIKTALKDAETAVAFPSGSSFILLAGDEELDFGIAGRIRAQTNAIYQLFKVAQVDTAALPAPALADVAVMTAALSAVAGLMRAETKITPLETPAISDRMLVVAVASVLDAKTAIIPSAPLYLEESGSGSGEFPKRKILEQYNYLTQLRGIAQVKRQALGEKPQGNDKVQADKLDAAISRYDAFVAKAAVADDRGNVPLSDAARVETLAVGKPLILRLKVEKAGGSLINTKNIATTFGVDPVKVTGGAIISYLLTDPSNARTLKAGTLICRTTLARLRKVQTIASPKDDNSPGLANCTTSL